MAASRLTLTDPSCGSQLAELMAFELIQDGLNLEWHASCKAAGFSHPYQASVASPVHEWWGASQLTLLGGSALRLVVPKLRRAVP